VVCRLKEAHFSDQTSPVAENIVMNEKALDELLEGKPVTITEAQSFGCRIFYKK
jgi:hypothetical protein